jgi:Flp pilus assembly protein TadD
MKKRNKKRGRATAIDQARRLLVSGHHQEALEFLEKGVQEFPNDAEIRLLYATVLLPFRPEDVAAQVTQAAELAPSDPVILVRAGGLMLGRRHLDAARLYLKGAREHADTNFVLMPALLNHEGCLALLDQEVELAEEKLSAAVEREPTSEPFACDLARVLAVQGRYTEAIEAIDRALEQAKTRENLERLRTKLINEISKS